MGRFHHVLDNRSFEYGSLRTDWLHSCLVAERFKLTEPRTGTLDKDSRGLTTNSQTFSWQHLASIEVENGSQLPISVVSEARVSKLRTRARCVCALSIQ